MIGVLVDFDSEVIGRAFDVQLVLARSDVPSDHTLALAHLVIAVEHLSRIGVDVDALTVEVKKLIAQRASSPERTSHDGRQASSAHE